MVGEDNHRNSDSTLRVWHVCGIIFYFFWTRNGINAL